MTVLPTTDLLSSYQPLDGPYDELLDGDGVRAHWQHVARTLDGLGPSELIERTRESRRLLVDDRVTYNVTTDDHTIPRPWMLDPVPVVVSAEEWAGVEAGLSQRAELLDLVLADLYGPRRLVGAGRLPVSG